MFSYKNGMFFKMLAIVFMGLFLLGIVALDISSSYGFKTIARASLLAMIFSLPSSIVCFIISHYTTKK